MILPRASALLLIVVVGGCVGSTGAALGYRWHRRARRSLRGRRLPRAVAVADGDAHDKGVDLGATDLASFRALVLSTGVRRGIPGDSGADQTPPTVGQGGREGVRVTIVLDANPLRAGQPTWVTTTVQNVGPDGLIWFHDGCGIVVDGTRGA